MTIKTVEDTDDQAIFSVINGLRIGSLFRVSETTLSKPSSLCCSMISLITLDRL